MQNDVTDDVTHMLICHDLLDADADTLHVKRISLNDS
jgi:hypothetical protein